MKTLLSLPFALLSLGSISLTFSSAEPYIGNSELRNIHLNFSKSFSNSDLTENKFIRWLDLYGKANDYFPYCQKLILEVAAEFPISNIGEDPKVIESVDIFYRSLESGYNILKSFGAFLLLSVTNIAKYLMESGFSTLEYSLNELIDLAAPSKMFGIEYGNFASDPEFQDLIHEQPEIIPHLSNVDQLMAIHQLYCKEKMPINILLDMVTVMDIKDLITFSKLPVIIDNKTRSDLIPLFNQTREFSKMPNTFKAFSKYPQAINCFKLVQDPNKLRKQELIILLPHHVNPNACDDIINLDLRKEIGGWRKDLYKKWDYFSIWPIFVETFEKVALFESTDIKDKAILDSLWNGALRFSADLYKSPHETRYKARGLIIEKENQSFIYQCFNVKADLSIFKEDNDKVVPALEEKIWEIFVKHHKGSGNLAANFLQISLIPRLFPSKVSRVVLAASLDESLFHKMVLERRGFEILRSIVDILNDLFEIKIDLMTLAYSEFTDLNVLTSSTYRIVGANYIEPIGIGKLMSLYNKNTALIHKKLLLEEVALKIAKVYSKNSTQQSLIKKLMSNQYHHNIPYDKLESIEDAPEYLDFLYSLVHPIPFFEKHMKGRQSDLVLSAVFASEHFGHNFLEDIATIAP